MMKRESKLRKSANNFMYSLLYQFVTVALGLILPRVILVGFGSEVNGLLSSITQVIACLALFEAGIQSVAIKSLYKTIANGDQKATNRVLSAVNGNYKRIGVLYCSGLILLSVLYPLLVDAETLSYIEVFLIVLFSGIGNVIAFFKQGKYRILLIADGREYIITNLNTIISIASNALKIILLSLKIQVYVVIIMTFLVTMIQVAFIDMYIKKRYDWIDLNEVPDYNALKQSKYALIHQISGLVFSNTDIVILTVFCDMKIVSIYAVYKLIVGHVANLIAMPFNSCAFALGQTFNSDRDKYIKLFDGIQIVFNIIVFSIMTATYLLLPPFISLYTAGVNDAVYSDKYLPILFVVAEVLNLMRIPTRHMVNCAGHFQETVPRTVIETVINLTCSIVGVYICGIYGVLLGTIAALLYRTVDFAIYSNKGILMRSSNKSLALYSLNIVAFSGIVMATSRMSLNLTSYLQFVGIGFAIAIPCVLLFALLNICTFWKEINNFVLVLKNKEG